MLKSRLLLFLCFFFYFGSNLLGQLKISLQIKQPSCIRSIGHDYSEEGDGSMLVMVSNGVPPYSFYFDGQYQTNGYLPGMIGGYYSVFVTDAIGQYGSADTILSSKYPSPYLLVNAMPPTTCNGNNGSLLLSGNSGAPPYQYSIDGANTFSPNGNFVNLGQGSYTLYTKDANGCMSSNYFSLVNSLYTGINPYGLVCFNCCDIDFAAGSSIISTGLTSCKDEGSAYVYKADLIAPDRLSEQYDSAIQFSYDGISYHNSNKRVQIDTIGNLAPGQYTYYAKDTITNKTASWVYTIGKSCDVYIDFVQVSASCGLSDGQLQVIAQNGASPYTYSMDGVNFQTANVFTGLAAGTYSVSVKDANGEITSSIATVYNKCPVVLATHKNTACNSHNGSIQAHGYLGTKPYLFSIDDVNFQTDSLFNNLWKGDYTVYTKDSKGYIDSFSNIQLKDSCLYVAASVSDEYCSQKNGNITANGSNGTLPYLFSIDGVNFQSNPVFPGLDSGNYILTIKDASNITDTIHAHVKNITYTVNLGNDTTLCTAQILLLNPSLLGASYVWQDGSSSNSFTVSKAGRYWVTATTNTKCIASDTIVVSHLDIGNIFTTHDTTACIGKNIVLDAKHAGAGFLWDNNSTKETRSVNTMGKYWVRVSTSGCSASDTITCNFIFPPKVALPTDTSFCSGKSLYLLPKNNNLFYDWSDGSFGDSLQIFKAGKYWVSITGVGCTTVDTILVRVKPNPKINLGSDTTLCAGQTITLNAVYANATYLWQDGSTQPFYTVGKQGDYSVDVTANGCDTTGKITVVYTSKPSINLMADTTLCNGDKLLLDASYPQSYYLWQDGSTSPAFTVTKAGTYMVNVSNHCGTSKDSVVIQYENCACQFYVPSAFTPNGDGRNDVFKPTYKCFFTGYKMEVFDRFGKTIFIATNADNGWDGTVNGQQQPTGVYIWEISYLDTLTGKIVKRTGTVVLVR